MFYCPFLFQSLKYSFSLLFKLSFVSLYICFIKRDNAANKAIFNNIIIIILVYYLLKLFTISKPFFKMVFFSSFVFSDAIEANEKSFKTYADL